MKHHHHHHHGTHHNRASAVKLTGQAAKAQHRKHGKTVEFSSEALAEGKAYKSGGVSLTFQDGSNYFFADMDASDLENLDTDSPGTTWNKEYR
jgi:hypothetical protein